MALHHTLQRVAPEVALALEAALCNVKESSAGWGLRVVLRLSVPRVRTVGGVVAALRSAGKGAPSPAASEDWSPKKTLQSWSAYDAQTKACVAQAAGPVK